jgi:SAM-dependent methyltransferase
MELHTKLFSLLSKIDTMLVYPWDKILNKICKVRLKNLHIIQEELRAKRGLEIGGPSQIFRDDGILPLYSIIQGLDGCNFRTDTIWGSTIAEGLNYTYYKNKIGYHYICDVVNLSLIGDRTYDFILCSHVLEHVANPLQAMSEMLRVLKNNGSLLLVIPNKEKTFDHDRTVTEFSHLLDDYTKKTGEDDLTHLEEILKFHDLKFDPGAGTFDEFKQRSENNFKNRALHQHTFDPTTIKAIINYFDLYLIAIEEAPPFNTIIFTKKK